MDYSKFSTLEEFIHSNEFLNFGIEEYEYQQLVQPTSGSVVSISSQDTAPMVDSTIEGSSHICTQCGKSFTRKDNLNAHLKVHSGVKPHACSICDKAFGTKYHLNRHVKTHANIEKTYTCETCDEKFYRKSDLIKHIRLSHNKRKASSQHSTSNKKSKKDNNALGVFAVHKFFPTEETSGDFTVFFDEVTPDVRTKLLEELEEKHLNGSIF